MTESTENLVAGFFIGSVACLPTEDYRTLKSDDGVELEAQVVSCVVDEAVTLRKSDGRVPGRGVSLIVCN